jgi:hypothetical protein
LDEKEFQLSYKIFHAFDEPTEKIPEFFSAQDQLKLTDAVESIGKRTREVSGPVSWEKPVQLINQAFWEYVEVLESCTVELFQQLQQVGLDLWVPTLAETVNQIKELLVRRLDNASWNILRIEKLLKEYRWASEKSLGKSVFWKKLLSFWKPLLDKTLAENLQKSQKYLIFNYKKFTDRYQEFRKLQEKIEGSLEKLSEYPLLHRLESSHQEKFQTLYQYLKLWELNNKSRDLPQMEIVQSLRTQFSVGRVLALFKEYYHLLYEELLHTSRELKSHTDKHRQEELLRKNNLSRKETHFLATLIAKYRDFALRTDPDPYVRTRWGFSEWIVGPEPAQSKELLTLGYKAEDLDQMYQNLQSAIEIGSSEGELAYLNEIKTDVQNSLHEMGQPLASKTMMKSYAEKVVYQLQQLDELGSHSWSVVEYIEQTLARLLRVDWKYHVLFSLNAFDHIYSVHQNIMGPIHDRQHTNRYNRFKRLLQQIDDWVKTKTTQKHLHEIELDMNDIRGYLQDFFAYVQRIIKEVPATEKSRYIKDLYRQLLEYRYLFGKFFYELRETDSNERMMRNQFLFVDQYFESIEMKLREWSQEQEQETTETEVEDE